MNADQQTIDAVLAFINTPDNQSIITQQWNKLNTSAADEVFLHLLKDEQNSEEDIAYLRGRRYFLHRCRNEGILHATETPPPQFDIAIQKAVHTFCNAHTTEELIAVYQDHSNLLLSEAADNFLTFLSLYLQDDEQLCERIRERRAQLEKCRMGDVAGAFPPDKISIPQHIIDILQKFVAAPSWLQKKQLLLAHQEELLSMEADEFIAFVTAVPDVASDPIAQELKKARLVFQRCRAEGVSAVIGDLPAADPVQQDDPFMQELIEELNQIRTIEGLIHENDIHDILHRKPGLAHAWNVYKAHFTLQLSDNGAKEQLHTLLGQILSVPKNDHPGKIILLRQLLDLPATRQLPELWASCQHMLGASLSQCPGENREQLIIEAIEHHKLALEVFNNDQFSAKRADNLIDMGNAYAQLSGGDRADNLEQAIRCYEEASSLITSRESEDMLRLNLNLGNTYNKRIKGDKKENVEKAIGYLSTFLAAVGPDTDSLEIGNAKLNLANAFLGRVKGERSDNIEQAIGYYKAAYEIHRADPLQDRLGLIHLGMSNAYRERVINDGTNNLEAAIFHAEESLQFLPRQQWPEKWAEANNLLGILTFENANGKEALLGALEYYKKALEVYDRISYRNDWAKIQLNSAAVWMKLQDDPQAKERAVWHLSNALEVYTKTAYPSRWSDVHNSLGRLYANMDPVSDSLLAKAEEHLRLSLEIRQADLLPASALNTLGLLGKLYFKYHRWELAHHALSEAIDIAKELFANSYTFEGQRNELGQNSDLYHIDVLCLIRMGQISQALERLEECRTRLLAEAVSLSKSDATVLSPADQAILSAARNALLQAETAFTSAADKDVNGPEANSVRMARIALRAATAGIRQRNPDSIPVHISLNRLLLLIPPGGALVAPYITPQGGGAFIIPHGTVTLNKTHVLELPALNFPILRQLLRQGIDISGDYRGLRIRKTLTKQEDVFSLLWTALMYEINNGLQAAGILKGAQVVIMPQGGLNLLPLHAACGKSDGQHYYFSNQYVVSYVPSGYVWELMTQRAQQYPLNATASLLAVINPTQDLRYCQEEGDEIAAVFDQTVRLNGVEALPEAVIGASRGKTNLHFACHGSYDWSNPLQSRLILAGKRPLNFTDIVKQMDLSACQLVVLSACETGLADVNQAPEEFLGLPMAFIQSGAKAVISTLWAVDDFSTMLLMKQFYHLHIGKGLSPSVALQQAQAWLRTITNTELASFFNEYLETASRKERISKEIATTRFNEYIRQADEDTPPFSDPYYWAAFILTGI